MSGAPKKSIVRMVAAPIKRAMPWAAALGLSSFLMFAMSGLAPALTGAKDVAPDDIGARASVTLSYRGGETRCGGAVYQDRYILTTAHCFTNGRGAMTKAANGWEVSYWSSAGPKRETRRVTKITIQENYLVQEKAAYPAPKAWEDFNFPIQHEDIAVVEISGTHPTGAISAVVPAVVNEYTAEKDAWKGATWLYVYGASVNGTGWKLQRALVGAPGLIDRVVPGRKPGIMNIDRKLVISTDGSSADGGFMKNISVCSGDSGTGAFLVDPNDIDFEDHPTEFPTTLTLKDGQPILVGLVANSSLKGMVTDVVPDSQKKGCGRAQKSDAIIAVRIDYHHDWIVSKTGGAIR